MDREMTDKLIDGYVLVPKEATAENGMKAKLIGEFAFERIRTDERTNEDRKEYFVLSWTEIKQVYKTMIAAAAIEDTYDAKAHEGRYP